VPPQWVTPSEFREDKNIQTWLVKIVSRDIRHITECYNGHTRKIMWRGVIHGKQFNSFPTKLQHSPRSCCRTREKHFRITVVRITKWSTSKRELIDWLIDWLIDIHLSHTSLGWRCTSACMARHRIICLSCAHQSLKLLNDSIFVPPAAIYSLFHGFSSIRTAVAPSLSLDQRHGTCSKTICVSRTCKLTVSVVHWRRVFLISTRHIERIRGAFCDDALYKLTFTFTLTFIINQAYT